VILCCIPFVIYNTTLRLLFAVRTRIDAEPASYLLHRPDGSVQPAEDLQFYSRPQAASRPMVHPEHGAAYPGYRPRRGAEMSYARHEYPAEQQFYDPTGAGSYQEPAIRAAYDAQQARYMQEQQAQEQQYREGLMHQERERMRSNPTPGRSRRSEAAAREREEQVMRDAIGLDAERLARSLGARQQRRDSL
jgi:hypothetical protein